MSLTNNATSIVKGWQSGFSKTKSSYHEKCLDAVGIPVDWKANDNEVESAEERGYELSGTEDELIEDSIINPNHIF